MASIIEGYTYDIFISYRQKDNKGDMWVSEFVEALKTELESTFKEEISVYFDINPHDGLLETHDVDASLKEKLKCLVFIPVISRTYCDPNCFAWEHEFKAFIEQAVNDRFGLKIKLPSGNVSTRVLPVRIHDLNPDDITLCETTLGGVLRGVDFIYKSSGVNRPLQPNEDHPKDNLNKTYYRDQINKVANAIDEIIHSLKRDTDKPLEKAIAEQKVPGGTSNRIKKQIKTVLSLKILNKKNIVSIFFLICLSVAIYLIYRTHYLNNNEKTIAVIPFTTPSNDNDLATYAIGSMQEIISKLQEVKSLTVRDMLSSQQYLDTKKSPAKLRSELNTNYLVEISIRRVAKSLKMWVGLTNTKNERQIWSSQYDFNEEQLMPLFTKIVQIIARNLNVNFSNYEIKNIEKDLTKDPNAYLNYLNGNVRLFTAMGNKFVDSVSFISAIKMYDRAIEFDPGFANAYARRAIARSWGYYTGQLNYAHIEKCREDILFAERINKDLPDVQIAYGFYYYYCKKDYLNALLSFHTATIMDPGNYQPLFYMALVYRKMGDWEKSQSLIQKVIKFNPQEALYLTNIGLSYAYLHNFDSALIYHQKAIDVNPEWASPYLNKIQALVLKYGNTSEAHALLDSAIKKTHESLTEYKVLLAIYDCKYAEALKEVEKSNVNDFLNKGNRDIYFAKIYNYLKNPKMAEIYYDTARIVLNLELQKDSNNAKIHSLIGIADAGKGKREKAIAEGIFAVELESKNKVDETDMIINLAEIYTMLGMSDEALIRIDYLLKNQSSFSTKLLQLDPAWKPLLPLKEMQTIIEKHNNN